MIESQSLLKKLFLKFKLNFKIMTLKLSFFVLFN